MDNKANEASHFKQINPGKVLLPLGLGTALSLMGDATLYTVLPTHAAEAGITLAAVGIILSANRIIRLFLNGPAGYAYDRNPRRKLFVPALFIGALSTAIYAVSNGFWPLLAGRLIWGLAWSGIWVGGATIILDVTNDRDRGRWTGLYQTWFFLGAAFGAFAGGWLTDQVGFSTTMWIGAAITALGGVAALIALPETHSTQEQKATHSNPGRSEKWRPHGELIGVISLNGINRFITAGVIAATLALLVQGQLATNSVVIGVATVTGILFGLRTILSMFAAPISGSLSDRIGNRWGVIIGALILGAIGMLLLVRNEPLIILLGICFSALAGGSVQSLVTSRTGDLVSLPERGKAIGLLHTAGDLGSALGPVTAYFLLRWITLNELYLLCAVLFIIGAGLALLTYLHYRKESTS
jgi:MFS family permease